MNKPNMTCRVCGKEYFCCSDSRQIGGWRAMACSEECYKEYMRRIEESRKPQATVMENDTVKLKKVTKKSEPIKQVTDKDIDED